MTIKGKAAATSILSDITFTMTRYPQQHGLKAETNLVYKRIRKTSPEQETDTLHQTAQMLSIISEVQVLGHFRSSRTHPIVHLIGISWEVDEHGQVSPVLALEYAQHNSLAKFLATSMTSSLTFEEKERLVMDIASGLSSIHEAGFIWGDTKPENVLLFQHESDPMSIKAMISDFGLALDTTSCKEGFRGYSDPWTAPEARSARGFDALKRAEIYSFGMLLWSVMLNGRQFDISVCCKWLQNNELEFRNSLMTPAMITSLKTDGKILPLASSCIEEFLPIPHCECVRILKLLNYTLALQPEDRMHSLSWIGAIYGTSRESKAPAIYQVPAFEGVLDADDLLDRYGAKSHLQPVATAIFADLKQFAKRTKSAPAFFQLGVFLATGFGCKMNVSDSIMYMRKSACLGFHKALGLYNCLLKAGTQTGRQFGATATVAIDLIDFEEDEDHMSQAEEFRWLTEAAANGSRYAAEQLCRSNRAYYEKALQDFFTSRVGCLFEGHAKANSPTIPLHTAALIGDIESLESLLEPASQNNIDLPDARGLTALACAMIAGQIKVVGLLVQAGADVCCSSVNGSNLLHWLAPLDATRLHGLVDMLPALSRLSRTIVNYSTVNICQHDYYETTMSPGTALDWAVDLRNFDAIEILLKLGVNPLQLIPGRPPAIHRTCARHDWQVLDLLVEGLSRADLEIYDASGRAPLAYAIDSSMLLERLLINTDPLDALWRTLSKLLHSNETDRRKSAATRQNESPLYHALKTGQTSIFYFKHLFKLFHRYAVLEPTGPNKWSVYRRALYSSDPDLSRQLGSLPFRHQNGGIMAEYSPDGLSMLHELAFLSSRNSVRILRNLRACCIISDAQWDARLLPRSGRPPLTPFQLAVLCGNTKLADALVEYGGGHVNPLQGVNKMRLLGFVVQYSGLDAFTPSTYLDHIAHDDVVRVVRRFPHPSGMETAVQYLLEREQQWWRGKFLGLADAEHYPFLREGHLRSIHDKHYKSFLIGVRHNTQEHNVYGHKYITILEQSFDLAMSSPYPTHAERIFFMVLNHFQGVRYCNFPYYHWLPLFITGYANLRRRENILHRAVRSQKVAIVRRLIDAGADCNAANLNWQTPLNIARLLDAGKDPDQTAHHGSFLNRLGAGPPFQVSDTAPSESNTRKILVLLETQAIEKPRRPWPPVRALREIRIWPWEEYEIDDLGFRFFTFYFSIFLLIVSVVTLVIRILFFFPYAFVQPEMFFEDYPQVVRGFTGCYKDCQINGSDPRLLCTGPENPHVAYITTGSDFVTATHARMIWIVDKVGDCTCDPDDLSRNQKSNKDPADLCSSAGWRPNCLKDIFGVFGSMYGKDAKDDQTDTFLDLLYDKCNCQCSWFGYPSRSKSYLDF